jgi:membrane protease subunit (stomatin/prohibitin family)
MPTYSERVMDHFMNPRNVGEIADADGVGTVGNPVCGDMMAFYIKIDEEKQCFCPYCESAVEETDPTCRVCGAELDFCPECGEALPHGAEECPECGTSVAVAEGA